MPKQKKSKDVSSTSRVSNMSDQVPQTIATQPIIGLEVVGRGIYLRPRKPYALKSILFKRENDSSYHSQETNDTYLLPDAYAVNDSPPMPENQSLNKLTIEESLERFDKKTSLDTNIAGGNGLFSVDVNMGQSDHMQSEDDSYFCSRVSFIPLWSVYLPDVTRVSDDDFEIEIPVPFKHEHRRQYEIFFERYGTHYVKRAWIGGKATVNFTVSKSSGMSKKDIQAGIKASYIGAGNAELTKSQTEKKENLQSNSNCTVIGKGGDELKLAALSSLDEEAYNKWLETIKENPQVIDMEVAGIWTLFNKNTEKAKALMDAYKEAHRFTNIDAVYSYAKKIYFIRGDKYFYYDTVSGKSIKKTPLESLFPQITTIKGIDKIDGAFRGDNLISKKGDDLTQKLFLFSAGKYVCYDLEKKEFEKECAVSILEGFPGFPFEHIDAALNAGPDSLYFFSGNLYVRYDMKEEKVCKGYPDKIKKRWAGLSFDTIDAACFLENRKSYFFRRDQYISYDMNLYQADAGYPRYIHGSYVEDWNIFDR